MNLDPNCGPNFIGPRVAKFRSDQEWTQDVLVAKLQVLGCNMTRDILANIELRRSIATDKQVWFFAIVFGVEIKELFPPALPGSKGSSKSRVVGIAAPIVTRRRSDARRGEDQA
jgi:hypothetical protein